MIVVRLQTVVSGEVAPTETVVLKVGSVRAGRKSNVIGAHAVLELNTRTHDESVRTAVVNAIRRIVITGCQASNSPKFPDCELYDRFSLIVNDDEATDRVSDAFAAHFGERLNTLAVQTASKDFSDIPDALGAPYTYWDVGGIDEQRYCQAAAAGRVAQDIPVNYSPTFAPAIQPTHDTGTEALMVAALAWLAN